MKRTKSKFPGNLAFIIMLLISSLWTFWGVSEMFHEGWYAPFEWIYFLIPAAISISLTVISTIFPMIGGILIVISGAVFSIFVFSKMSEKGNFSISNFLSWISYYPSICIEASETEYYSISYNGVVIKRNKREVLGFLGFRAVRTGKTP